MRCSSFAKDIDLPKWANTNIHTTHEIVLASGPVAV